MSNDTAERPGWRADRPAEDPAKTKRWGFISAKPSEYLVHVRGGRVRARSSGQGATCFKWPWDSVAIVPTSLQQLSFVADQVTLERVGVEVRGFAAYRVTEPLLAYRVLNFSYAERAQEKLAESLTAMFVGGTRRLVANLGVDDVLSKRKAALAVELLREIAPVVGARGRPDDDQAEGWGVVIDTIEIQEVRVLSETVFASMQAPYRVALEQREREMRAVADREVATKEAEHRRATEAARLEAEAAIAALQRQGVLRAAEAENALALRRIELATAEAAGQVAAHAQRAEAARTAAAEQRFSVESTIAVEELRAGARLRDLREHTIVDRAVAEVEQLRAEANARLTFAHKLPELAGALGRKLDVRVHQHDGGNPFTSILDALQSVVELAKQS